MIKDSVDRFNIRRHPEKVDRIVSSAWYSMVVGDPFVGGVHQSQERLLLGSKQFLIQGSFTFFLLYALKFKPEVIN